MLSTGTEWEANVPLEEGQSNPDIDFAKFAETGQPIKGDYNADTEVTIADAVLLTRFVVEDTALTDDQIAEILNHEPDYDEDSLVTITDIIALLNKLNEG